MLTSSKLALLGAGLAMLAGSATAAPLLVTTGETVGGTTTSIDLTPDNSDGDVDVSLDGSGNLVYAVKSTTVNTDWWVQFNDISVDASVYTFMQVDFLSVTAGAEASRWQLYWIDGNSGIGGPNNSATIFPTVDLPTAPFSVVFDMVGDSTSTAGQGWGDEGSDIVTRLRLDMYELSEANKGETFVISSITFGSALVPEPSSLALMGLAGLLIARRRRG